jgi:hypothetical protein
MPTVPPSLLELLRLSETLPAGSLDWYTQEEVQAALDAGLAGQHEHVVRTWLAEKERRPKDEAAEPASRAHWASTFSRYAIWAAIAGAIVLVALVVLKQR